MSAIVGFFHRNGAPAQPQWLDQMMTAVAHRGVDDSGTWCGGSIAFGHQMMWVTPESQQEKLPLVTRGGDLVITADVRLDNREELCEQLNLFSSVGQPLSDSALILAAYEKWGLDCPKFLLGDFAFALWDARLQRLLCVRDPMGVRFLHYYQTPYFFAFSTEIKGILALPGIVKQLNERHFAQRLISTPLMQLDPEATYFQDIHHVRAAHAYVIEPECIKPYEYWHPEQIQSLPYQRDDEYLDAFRDLFAKTVRCRLRSAYPVAAFLSGGLDSSPIACVAATQLRAQGKQLTVVSSALPEDYQGTATDEREYIQRVCHQAHLRPLSVTAAGKSPYTKMEGNFFYRERPAVYVYYLYDALQAAIVPHQARTLLDGVGGELGPSAPGDLYFKDLFTTGHWIKLFQEIRAMSQLRRRSMKQIFAQQVISPLFSKPPQSPNLFESSPINTEFANRMGLISPLGQTKIPTDRVQSSMQDLELYILKSLQGLRSECSAFYPINRALPYLDRRILEFCLAVPPHLKFQNGWGRYLIRKSMDGILPSQIQWRRSKGPFSPDYYDRLRTFRREVTTTLDMVDENEAAYHYLDIQRIRQTLTQYSQRSDWTPKVYGYGNDIAKEMIHQGVIIIHFLRWFEQFT